MAHRPVVLLVDDDASIRSLLSTLFTVHGGFRIGGVAENGLEGAILAAELKPDVVVLDFFMPRWDGSKAAAFIRERCPESKIIAFSAVLTEQPEWADDFLVKTDVDKLIPMAEGLCAA
jgi:chemotaxis response regulator CheB